MNIKRKVTVSLVLFSLVCVSFIVFAAKGSKTVDINYNDIKIKVDGALLMPVSEPFIMSDGKIYASLEDIAKAIGKKIYFDAKNATVYVGKQPTESWCYLSDLPLLNWKGGHEMNRGEKGKPFSIAGKEYFKGIQMSSYENECFIEYNLAAEYTRLSGELGIDDCHRGDNFKSQFFIYADDELIFFIKDVKPADFPIAFNLNITNCVRLKLKTITPRVSWSHEKYVNWANVILTR